MTNINELNETMHKIEAKLYPNYLGKGEGAYIARTKAEAPLHIRDICAAAKNRGGFTGNADDLDDHVQAFINEVVYQILDGYSVQMGSFFSLHTRVSGTYHGENDHIHAEDLHVSFRTLSHLKKLLAGVEIENQGIAGDGAFIDEITDVHTDSLNSVLTPGKMIHILGHKVKVEGEGDTIGVWFVSQAEGNVRIKVTENLGINKAMELMAEIPALEAGQYKLEIVTKYSGGGSGVLKNPRVISAGPELSVQ
ncbi:DUF4469 domain-containing protein [Breznakiellaceae bacterium SP9]